MDKEQEPPKEWPEVMTPTKLAKYLQLNVNTVYKLLREGRLPGRRVGRRCWRIPKSEIDAIFERDAKRVKNKQV